MTDYIKRTDAVKIAEKYGLPNGSVLGRHTGLADCIARDISELPAADVAEVVHGQWYMLDDCANAGLYCSACGRRVHHEEFAYKKLKSKYCPNCGAKKPAAAPLYRCDKCGWEPEDPTNPPKFCPECGDVFDDNDRK